MSDIEKRKAEAFAAFKISQDNAYPADNKTEELICELLQPSPTVADGGVEKAIELVRNATPCNHGCGLEYYADEIGIVLKAAQQPRQECPHNCPHCYAIEVRNNLPSPPKEK